jgi:hypothetical protein
MTVRGDPAIVGAVVMLLRMPDDHDLGHGR